MVLRKISKIEKPLVRLTNKKGQKFEKEGEEIQIMSIREERGIITTNLMNTKRIIKEYYKLIFPQI